MFIGHYEVALSPIKSVNANDPCTWIKTYPDDMAVLNKREANW